LIFNFLFVFRELRIIMSSRITSNNKTEKTIHLHLKKEENKEKHAQNRNTDGAGLTTGVAETKN